MVVEGEAWAAIQGERGVVFVRGADEETVCADDPLRGLLTGESVTPVRSTGLLGGRAMFVVDGMKVDFMKERESRGVR